ncbi:MAG: DDE-type integrase/transposase/recombinase [Proteobacteria bacterium]|nr:DDE-type integrase/transposase/recombinase [Pseudomonadota bacterium]
MENYFSAKQLEALHLTSLPSCKRLINIKATKENWPFRARKGKGGGREYNINDLPAEVRSEFLARKQRNKEEKVHEKQEEAIASLLKLQDGQLQKAYIRERIVQDYIMFKKSSGLSHTKARAEFCASFNDKKILPDNSIRAVVNNICERTLFNLEKNYETMGLAGLADNYGNRKGASKVESRPEIKELILGLIYFNPDIKCHLIMRGLRTRYGSKNLPSYRTIQNWVAKWRHENESVLLAIKNPDAWRNKYQSATGSQSENITRLNQRWEYDSTPTDIMLNDGSRHNIVGVIDVYSRRLKLLVSKTSNTQAVTSITRACLLEWGVPEEVKTDNGADYASKHMRRVFDSLEVRQIFCQPFTPEGKPHIERVFKTFSHDVLEILPGYIGHNVSDRKNIESRKSFADHIMGKAKNRTAEYLSAEELQEFCDKWIENYYMQEPHRGLNNKTPQSMVDGYNGEVRRIKNERALDILLLPTSGDGIRTVTKKGIAIENAYYDSNDLGLYIGKQVKVLYSEAEWGKIYVFTPESKFICEAFCPERSGISRSEVASAKKSLQKRLISESKQIIKGYSKKYMVKNLAQEIVNQKIDNNPDILAFPKTEVSYESRFLQEAENILASKQEMPASRNLTVEEQNVLEQAEKARNDNVVSMPATILSQERYKHWKDLNQRFLKGERLTENERNFYANYKESSDFQTQELLDELGIGAV